MAEQEDINLDDDSIALEDVEESVTADVNVSGVIPFVIIMLFTVFVIYLFPDIALYIPFKL